MVGWAETQLIAAWGKVCSKKRDRNLASIIFTYYMTQICILAPEAPTKEKGVYAADIHTFVLNLSGILRLY